MVQYPTAGTRRVNCHARLPLSSQPTQLSIPSPHRHTVPSKSSFSIPAMARNSSYRTRGSRSSATSRGNRSSQNRRTPTFTSNSHASSTRSASSVPVGPSGSRAEVHRGPFPDTSVNTPSEGQDDADGNEDTLIEVVMAVDMTPRGIVGCCYYVARDEKLYFMEDIQCGDVDVIDSRGFPLSRLLDPMLTRAQ